MVYKSNRLVSRVLVGLLCLAMLAGMLSVYAAGTYADYISGDDTWANCKSDVVKQLLESDGNRLVGSISSNNYTTNASEAAGKGWKTYDNVGSGIGTIYVSEAGELELFSQAKIIADAEVAKARVGQAVSGIDLRPDIVGASKALDGLSEPLEMVVGVIFIVVMMGLTVFTALDLLYLTMPIMREKMAGADGAKSKWITREAIRAVRLCEVDGSEKNSIVTYLRLRIWAFIAVGIVIYIFATGNISLIVNVVLNIVGSFIGALEGLGA